MKADVWKAVEEVEYPDRRDSAGKSPTGKGREKVCLNPGKSVLRKRAQVLLAGMCMAAVLLQGGCTRQSGTGGSVTESVQLQPDTQQQPNVQSQPDTQQETIEPFESVETLVPPEAEHGGAGTAGTEANSGNGAEGSSGGIAGSEAKSSGAGTSDSENEAEIDGWQETILIATDIHYLARELTDGGSRFQEMVEYGDGKVVTYIEQITDAFLDEVISLRPNMLILSGDLTLEGEKQSHMELAEKLRKVERAGIPVLVIPGNHDINNRQAAHYEGTQRLPAEYTSPEEFREIYREFGYDEAISEDRSSLSYVCQVDGNLRLLMLDSCQYRPIARVGGAILSETQDWVEKQLEAAWDEGIEIIPVAHHNLLEESQIYVDDCTIEHSEQLVELFDNWDVRLFLSGHLHVQHFMREEDDYGIWEVVTSSLATPNCQYGVLNYRQDGSFTYNTWSVDVEGWAKTRGRTEDDLLHFDAFKEPFLRRVFYNQAVSGLEAVSDIPAIEKEQMAAFYADLNVHYYQGTAYLVREEALQNPLYELWMNDGYVAELSDYVEYILKDAKRDYNRIEQ